jgi:predicted HTH transcriptional regulator
MTLIITTDALKKERMVARRYRNRRVGEFLKELKFTEGRSTGMPKIYHALARNGSSPPRIETNLAVKSKVEMDEIEQSELERTELELLEIFDKDHQFTADDICNIHELWLGDLYPMAGKYRTVNMEKDGFLFAMSAQIEKLMKE